MPVILATQEAEIKRITVPSQLRQIILETLSQKYSTQNRAFEVEEVVWCLPWALSSNSSREAMIYKK
jgi:hypothetical protein